jgi:protein-S-isoprenylcysteine O-methyltransferase Ste14
MIPANAFERYMVTVVLWSAWCVIHSLLSAQAVHGAPALQRLASRPAYRLLYNLIAVTTLLAVWYLTPWNGEKELIDWQGWWSVLQTGIGIVAVLMFAASFRGFDTLEFLGLRPFLPHTTEASDQQKGLITTGIYGLVRHPQFSAGLLLLWSRDLTDVGLVINGVLSVYLIVGARIEEARLLEAFGGQYSRYRDRTPAFVPSPLKAKESVKRLVGPG